MAKREAVLTMTPAEERALARLIGFMCRMESRTKDGEKMISNILGHGDPQVQLIGNINAALNGDKHV